MFCLFQFSEKLDNMLEVLVTTAEQVENAEPVSAHPDKLRDQLEENKALIEDLDRRLGALHAVKESANEMISQANDDDESVKGIYNESNLFANFTLFCSKRFMKLKQCNSVTLAICSG